MTRIVGDIGGTNARFAYVDGENNLQSPRTLPTADHASLGDALRAYVAQTGTPMPSHVCLAVAAAVNRDEIRFLNNPWRFSRQGIRDELGVSTFEVINDFGALARCLPGLREDRGDLALLSEGDRKPGSPAVVFGPGTGLGVSCYVPVANQRGVILQGEGGHTSARVHDDREIAVMMWLRDKHGRTSVERMVSGAGMENIYMALCAIDGVPASDRLSAAEIVRRTRSGEDALAREALRMFCAVMGDFAGDLALTFGAFGGVFIGGGIAPRMLDLLRDSEFEARFHAKDPASHVTRDVPIYVITHPYPGLLGARDHLSDLLGT